jgi:hypothetical protein
MSKTRTAVSLFAAAGGTVALFLALASAPEAKASWENGCCATSEDCQGTLTCWEKGTNGAPNMPCGPNYSGYCMEGPQGPGGDPPDF